MGIFGSGNHNTAESIRLDDLLEDMNRRDYGPGGRIYEKIKRTSGQAAADKAWQQVQQNLATMVRSPGLIVRVATTYECEFCKTTFPNPGRCPSCGAQRFRVVRVS